LCSQFGIAVSTLYVWKHRLLEHKELALGALVNLKKATLDFLRGFFETGNQSNFLSDFFHRHGFSFMQSSARKTARSRPP